MALSTGGCSLATARVRIMTNGHHAPAATREPGAAFTGVIVVEQGIQLLALALGY